ncbi:MAG: insulinase family protein [Ruminococcaceae bacterium]|nr:insulinase family protein [Oscillospiraceae bacterium]
MYNTITLSNGVRIVYENIPYVRSASVGVWVNVGTRDEMANENGASHFIEHMVFKGTKNRTAAQLAFDMDRIGGQINAFTTKENTCFYGRVLDTHVQKIADILCDMLLESNFHDDDVNNERNVIIEEIGMYEDTPDDLVTEQLFSGCFKGSSLARPVLGTRNTLGKMDGEFLKNYMTEHYTGDKIVVVLAGNISDSDVQYFAEHLKVVPVGDGKKRKKAKYVQSIKSKKKTTEQNHLCLAFPSIGITDDRRYAVQLMSNILGGGMSSRLFQSVREDKGLCYSIYSFGASYQDTGLLGIYTALGKETERPALSLIAEEIKRFKEFGVTADELELARDQVKSNILMSLESTSARMNRLGHNLLYFDYCMSYDQTIANYDKVTVDDIAKAAEMILDFDKVSFSAVGRVGKTEEYGEFLRKINE